MRPKKRILVASADAEWLKLTELILSVHGYAVTLTEDVSPLSKESEDPEFDAVLVRLQSIDWPREEYRCGITPVVVVTPEEKVPEILEAVKSAVQRFRGPTIKREAPVYFASDYRQAA